MKKLIVVSHTHWDREWYQTFQEFRIRLVRLMDKLLDNLEKDPNYRYFTLDGQTVVLEDYLEVRPDREPVLRRYIREGRLLVGPWYILPDEFLVGGEALIRNLLRGHRIAQDFGRVMKVGYLPDPFGQIGQMPQILQGFGIKTAVVWRGVPHTVDRSAFRWRSPDGSEVLAIFLPFGYCDANRMPVTIEPFLDRLARLQAKLEPYAVGEALLLMNGCDHEEPQPELPAMIAAANARLADAQVVHGTLEQYIETVQNAATDLPLVTGELRDCRRMHLLSGVLSTRMWIKQRNATCENLLTRWAEPFLVWSSLVAAEDATPETKRSWQGLLNLAWKYLLQNQPHDSICGCSVDQVHRDMMARYDACEQIGETIVKESLQTIAARVGTKGRYNLVVFNPVSGPRIDWAMATIPAPQGLTQVRLVDAAGQRAPLQVLESHGSLLTSLSLDKDEMRQLMDQVRQGTLPGLGMAIAACRVSRHEGTVFIEVTVVPDGRPNLEALRQANATLTTLLADPQVTGFQVQVRPAEQLRVLFLAGNVPGYGYKAYTLQAVEEAAVADSAAGVIGSVTPPTIENEFYRVTVDTDGTLTVTDKRSGAVFTGLNRFVDGGDAGDEYNYCPPAIDRLIVQPAEMPQAAVIEQGPVRFALRISQVYRLPVGLQADRQARSSEMVDCPIESIVSLYPGVPRIDIHTQVENRAQDHRLRVYFPLPFITQHSWAEGTFDLVERPVAVPQGGPDWEEQPVGTYPQKGFVDVHNGKIGLLVANRGLPEYEVVGDGQTLAITLLRCVGWLSRDDLTTRSGHAGPAIPTPEAQCLGRHAFDYALVPYSDDRQEALAQALAFNCPLRVVAVEQPKGDLPASGCFLEIEPANLVLSALKPAEDGHGFILRFWNMGIQATEGRVRLGLPWRRAWRANMAEEPLTELYPDGAGWLHLQAGGRGVVTLRFC